jgi:quercetin dioxygenase-like cupin family protein
LRLALRDHRDGVEVAEGLQVVYDVDRNEARVAPARVRGHALVWELGGDADDGALLAAEVDLGLGGEWVLRCDRVDFPPGGVAYRHTHPGPGIRCLLFGSIRIETEGAAREYGPFEAWFESGPEPVLAVASESEPTAFVRVLLLPREWEGRRTIRYVDPADEAKPKLQRATVFFDHVLGAGSSLTP